MEALIKIAACALLASAVSLVLKRKNPELAVPLAAAVCCVSLAALTGLLRPVLAVMEKAKSLSGLGEAYFLPVTKCVLIGILAKTAADLCRDSGQSALAGAVELGGAVGAMFVSLPLLETLLGLLERLL